MATPWKKMAAAFGRAVSDPAATKKGRNLVLESKTVKEAPGDYRVTAQDTPEQRSYKGGRYQGDEAWELTHDERVIPEEAKRIYENYDLDYERAYGPEGAYQRAVELSGVDDGNWPIPRTIEDFKETYGFDIGGNMPKHKPGYRKAWEREASSYSDMNLEKEFNDAFDEAAENHGYKKWREESKDMSADDGFGGSLHDVNREDAVQRSREEIIEALQKNTDRDVTDVLRDFGYISEE